MLLLIDNYDSFTYNLVHYLGELGAESSCARNDCAERAGGDGDEPRRDPVCRPALVILIRPVSAWR